MSNDEPGPDPEGNEPERDRPGRGGVPNPFSGTPFEAMGGDLNALFGQMQSLLTGQGSGPINWELAKQTAQQTIREAGDASLTAEEREAVDTTVRLAEHWLDEATNLPAGTAGAAEAWNRSEWLDGTLPAWRKLVDPLAEHIVGALGRSMPSEAASMAGPLGEMFNQIGGLMFGVQVGQGLGQLATEVCGATDIGLPIGPSARPVLLPANVTKFGEGLGLPADDVRLYLALREGAHQRLFHHAPWLTADLFSSVEEYARGMQVDLSKLEEAAGQVDISNPEALQNALNSGLLEPEETPRQRAALNRLETTLALVEGWVDDVVTQAAAPRMPNAGQLREAVRRRRAEGGPAEQTFVTLVGLRLRPRRLRDAANLWAALREAHGADGREAAWAHPDLLPTTEDLDDPLGFVERRASGSDLDLDLASLGLDDLDLGGTTDQSDERPDSPGNGSGDGSGNGSGDEPKSDGPKSDG